MGDAVEIAALVVINVVSVGAAFVIARSLQFTFDSSEWSAGKLVSWALRIAMFWAVWMLGLIAGTGLLALLT